MNSIVLMAEILTDPEKRLTADGQYTVASFMAQFPNPRQDDAPFRVRVTGWNRLADEIMEKYHRGDQVIVEGRLRMEMLDRGAYKEKVAEITAQRVYPMGAGMVATTSHNDSYGSSPSSTSWSDHNYQSSGAGASVPKAAVPMANQSPVGSSPSSAPYTGGFNQNPSTAPSYDSGVGDDDIPF
ncbi:MAG: single-stranded DNA-binding protein [Pseudanabaena sp. ELA607]|jgi:single-stranded DNA-binding protein